MNRSEIEVESIEIEVRSTPPPHQPPIQLQLALSVYYILKGRLSIHIRLLLGLACESMQYRAGVRNTTFFMQSPTAGVGCKNEINLDRGSNTRKRSAWPTDVPSCLADRPPKPPRQCHHSLDETSGSSAWNILSRQAFQARPSSLSCHFFNF